MWRYDRGENPTAIQPIAISQSLLLGTNFGYGRPKARTADVSRPELWRTLARKTCPAVIEKMVGPQGFEPWTNGL